MFHYMKNVKTIVFYKLNFDYLPMVLYLESILKVDMDVLPNEEWFSLLTLELKSEFDKPPEFYMNMT